MYQKNVIKIGGDFGTIFSEKTMGYIYSIGYFSENGSLLRMAITNVKIQRFLALLIVG